MKKLVILSAILLFSLISLAQSKIYDENGQHLKETSPPKSQANIFETGIYSLNQGFYPRATLEAYSVFDNGFGLWSFNRFQQPVIKDEWRKKGYDLFNYFNLGISIALSYDFVSDNLVWYKTFLGIAYQSGQMFVGPTGGVYITKNKLQIKAFGCYSLNTAYKNYYSEELIKKYAPLGDPVYIKGFDPNSWYFISINYQLKDRLSLGISSERFYGTNFTAQYDLKTSWRDMDKLYVKAMSGFDFEFKQNTFFMGLVLVL